MCGEQPLPAPAAIPAAGSPPRVRGTVMSHAFVRLDFRITPACAGNSLCIHTVFPTVGDHPRVCGEQIISIGETVALNGSPPRVRGTVPAAPVDLAVLGITPACAGNSSSFSSKTTFAKDHPRVCGEQVIFSIQQRLGAGSPPRVRGTVRCRPPHKFHDRITPACAGNRLPSPIAAATRQDHPRVCGEQIHSPFPQIAPLGSPPRVRGTGGGDLGLRGARRITPACAGNRRPPGHRSGGCRDHPRVCGEQHILLKLYLRSLKSPPRVRGTAEHAIEHFVGDRITPACAGNSNFHFSITPFY